MRNRFIKGSEPYHTCSTLKKTREEEEEEGPFCFILTCIAVGQGVEVS